MNIKNIVMLGALCTVGLIDARSQSQTSSSTENQEPSSQKRKTQKPTQQPVISPVTKTYKSYLDTIKQMQPHDVLMENEYDFTPQFKKFIIPILRSNDFKFGQTDANEIAKDALIEAAIVRNMTWTGNFVEDIEKYSDLRNKIINDAQQQKK